MEKFADIFNYIVCFFDEKSYQTNLFGLGVKIFGKWAIEQYIKIFELCFSFFIQKYKYKTKYKTKYTSFNRI